jgi:hypothetical protein
MRKTMPKTRINKLSRIIKELKRKRPLSGNETGKNLSLDMLYKPGTVALNNRLFKNHPSKFISKTKKDWYIRTMEKIRNSDIAIIFEEYYEESNSTEDSQYSIWKITSR